jgi:phosphoribosyl 1,2-cyclic phosphodiesterase
LNNNPSFCLKFWGVRGSIACPGPNFKKYGGNTPCVEVRCDNRIIIFDAGTGLRSLGDAMISEGNVEADIFFSHAHMDHVGGLPFFRPAFDPRNTLRIWSGPLENVSSIKEVFRNLMSPPLFPVPIEIFNAKIHYNVLKIGQSIKLSDEIDVLTTTLNHPQGAVGYRINFNGKSICYISDTEHAVGKIDENIKNLIQNSDVVIYDSTYTDEEYPNHIGWGHSTWTEGVKLCDAASVGKLIIFHHDPSHDDSDMDQIALVAEKHRPGTLVAKEGMTITL